MINDVMMKAGEAKVFLVLVQTPPGEEATQQKVLDAIGKIALSNDTIVMVKEL